MAAAANNGMQTFLTALVGELTEPKVANFLKGMGLRLSAENLLPAGSWPKGSNVMDEMMEGTLLSMLSELPAPVTFSTYDTGTHHDAGSTANWIQLHGLAITEHVMIASRALNSGSLTGGSSTSDQNDGKALDINEANSVLDNVLFAAWSKEASVGKWTAADQLVV